MVLYREDDFLHRHVQAFGHGLDDADIGLVRYEPVELFLGDACLVERLLRDRAKCFDRDLEHLVALHDDVCLGRTGRGKIL